MKTTRTVTAVALAGLLFGLSGQAQAEQQQVRVATDGTFPPYSMAGPDGSLSGFDVDITHALCAEMQVRCELTQYDFDAMIPALKARKFDMIVASMAITEERRRSIAFSDKYEGGYSQFIGRKDSGLSGEPGTMADRRIGVQRGSIQENYAREVFGAAGAKVTAYDNPELAWLDLQSGRLDAVMVEVGVGVELKKREGAEVFDFFGPKFDDPDYFGTGSGIAVRKQDTALLARLNQALKAILANGTYKRINDTYFDYDQYE